MVWNDDKRCMVGGLTVTVVVACVQEQPGLAVPDAEVKSRLTQAVQGFCRSTEPRLTPLVEVTVLSP